MAKIGRPIKFVIRLTPEERTRLDGMIHCGKGSVNSALILIGLNRCSLPKKVIVANSFISFHSLNSDKNFIC